MTATVHPLPAIRVDRPDRSARDGVVGPMRVAIVTESFLPSVNGVARSVARVAEHLVAAGHHVMVVAPGPGPDVYRGASVVRLPSVQLPICRAFTTGLPTPRLTRALDAFEPDVVHLASPILVGARAARLARRSHVPTVAIFQTDVAGFATAYGWRLAARPAWAWLARLHGRVDRTLAPSSPVVRDLAARGVPEVHRWGRGVDHDGFRPEARTRPATEDVDVVRVGYVGRLAAEKRVERLAVLADLPGTELVVVGDGDRRAQLERALPSARFTGLLTGPELHREYADLDVFVHTGEHETFCQTVQEAQSSAVAVVAPAAGGPLDLVDDDVDGRFWDPADPASLRRTVAELVADPAQRRRLGTTARDRVARRGWDAMTRELVDHYRAVIGSCDAADVAA